MHSLPTARVIPVVSTFGSPKLPRRCGQCSHGQIELQAKLLNYFLGSNKSNINQSHGLRARITHTFTYWWPARSVLWYSVSMSSASMVCLPATYEIWTNICCAHHRLRGDCTRAHSRRYTSKHTRAAWDASTPSHLLHAGPVSNLHCSPSTCSDFFFNLKVFIKE